MSIADNFAKGKTSLTISFTNTKPNEHISTAQYSPLLNFRGEIVGASKGSTLYIQGGDNTGAYMKSPKESSGFFMTDNQRRTLMRVIKGFASTSDKGFIQSNNGDLQEMCQAIYRNYCG